MHATQLLVSIYFLYINVDRVTFKSAMTDIVMSGVYRKTNMIIVTTLKTLKLIIIVMKVHMKRLPPIVSLAGQSLKVSLVGGRKESGLIPA